MKRIIIIALCFVGITCTSCENKERLEEIKAELKGEKPGEKKKPENKVNISTPSQNQAPVAASEAMNYDNSMSGYENQDYSSEYPIETYESDYSTDYESEY